MLRGLSVEVFERKTSTPVMVVKPWFTIGIGEMADTSVPTVIELMPAAAVKLVAPVTDVTVLGPVATMTPSSAVARGPPVVTSAMVARTGAGGTSIVVLVITAEVRFDNVMAPNRSVTCPSTETRFPTATLARIAAATNAKPKPSKLPKLLQNLLRQKLAKKKPQSKKRHFEGWQA